MTMQIELSITATKLKQEYTRTVNWAVGFLISHANKSDRTVAKGSAIVKGARIRDSEEDWTHTNVCFPSFLVFCVLLCHLLLCIETNSSKQFSIFLMTQSFLQKEKIYIKTSRHSAKYMCQPLVIKYKRYLHLQHVQMLGVECSTISRKSFSELLLHLADDMTFHLNKTLSKVCSSPCLSL